jgi:hypothetical protein
LKIFILIDKKVFYLVWTDLYDWNILISSSSIKKLHSINILWFVKVTHRFQNSTF